MVLEGCVSSFEGEIFLKGRGEVVWSGVQGRNGEQNSKRKSRGRRGKEIGQIEE